MYGCVVMMCLSGGFCSKAILLRVLLSSLVLVFVLVVGRMFLLLG